MEEWMEKVEELHQAHQAVNTAITGVITAFKDYQKAVDDLLKVTPQGQPFLVDVKEAERLLGISRSALNRLIDKGHLHSVKIFGSMRIRRSEIESFNGTDKSIGRYNGNNSFQALPGLVNGIVL